MRAAAQKPEWVASYRRPPRSWVPMVCTRAPSDGLGQHCGGFAGSGPHDHVGTGCGLACSDGHAALDQEPGEVIPFHVVAVDADVVGR